MKMKSPRLPYYYYLPLAVISLFFTLAVAFTVWSGVGSWSHSRTVNWGYGWLPEGIDWRTMIYVKTVLSSLPAIVIALHFLRKFTGRKEMGLVKALLLALLGFVLSASLMFLVR